MELRPPERLVGLGIAYPHADLDVACGTCKAPEGEPCNAPRKLVKGMAHASRQDKARNKHRGKAMRLFDELENAALKIDPNGPLWAFQSIPHHCGTLGPHVMTECTTPLKENV